MREETARLHGARVTSNLAPRLLLNFSWAEHEANANDHIQVLLGKQDTQYFQIIKPLLTLKEKKNYHLPGMVISPSHTQSLPPYKFVPPSPSTAV